MTEESADVSTELVMLPGWNGKFTRALGQYKATSMRVIRVFRMTYDWALPLFYSISIIFGGKKFRYTGLHCYVLRNHVTSATSSATSSSLFFGFLWAFAFLWVPGRLLLYSVGVSWV